MPVPGEDESEAAPHAVARSAAATPRTSRRTRSQSCAERPFKAGPTGGPPGPNPQALATTERFRRDTLLLISPQAHQSIPRRPDYLGGERFEERRKRAHDAGGGKDGGRQQDRAQVWVLPTSDRVQNRPGDEVGRDREDRLPRKRTNIVAPFESVCDS